MEVHLPKVRNEVNLNTAMHLVTIATVLIGIGAMWSEQRSQNNQQDEWIKKHETQHSAILLDINTTNNSFEQRLKLLELALTEDKNRDYRIAQLEKGIEVTNDRITQTNEIARQQAEDIRNDISQLSTQVELSKQILIRLEAKQVNTNTLLQDLPKRNGAS